MAFPSFLGDGTVTGIRAPDDLDDFVAVVVLSGAGSFPFLAGLALFNFIALALLWVAAVGSSDF